MEDLKKLTDRFNARGSAYPPAEPVKVEPVVIAGIDCFWFTPGDVKSNRLTIYVHGGGFVVGSIKSHGNMVTYVAKELRAKVLFIEYSLAPDKPFPNPVNDILKVYKTMIEDYPDLNIDLIGDSAGGGLIISCIGDLLKQQIKLPRKVVMISPWIDLNCDNPSFIANKEKDTHLNREALIQFAKSYIGNSPAETANPKKVILSSFPPVLILAGSREILLDDSRHFYNLISRVQPMATLSIYNDMDHVWLRTDIFTDASQKALSEIARFISKPPE